VAAPTGTDREVYKSPVRSAETRILVQLDEPVFTSPFFDDFLGSSLNGYLWDTRNYSWGNVTVSGSVLTVGVYGSSISTPYVSSKPKLAFPSSREFGWTLTMRLSFPTLASHGNFVMVGSLDTPWRVLSVEANSVSGVAIRLEGVTPAVVSNLGAFTGWFRVQVTYDPIANTHTLWVDDNDDGAYTPIGTCSAVGRHPDSIVIGNSVAIQGGLADWTKINVDWVRVDGMSETVELPEWAGPMYIYDAIGYEDELWATLPQVEGWRSSHHKKNATDALTVDLAELGMRGDYPAQTWGDLYADYNWSGRQIRVETRVCDGFGRWTSWKRDFTGMIDEVTVSQSPIGERVLQLRARDVMRRQVAEHTILARAYGDDSPPITGVIEGMTAAQMIEDILLHEIGLAPSQFAVDPCAGCLKPKTYNIANRSADSVLGDLIDQLVYAWYPRKSDGKLIVTDLFWGTGVADHAVSLREEVESADRASTAWRHVAGVVFSIDNSEFLDGGFSTRYPITSLPFYGDTINVSSQICPDDSCLRLGRPLHYLAWKAANRDLGSIDIRMECQDWLEQDMELAVQGLAGIAPSRPWIVDGWDYTFTAGGFSVVAHLVSEEPEEEIRGSVLSSRAGWQ